MGESAQLSFAPKIEGEPQLRGFARFARKISTVYWLKITYLHTQVSLELGSAIYLYIFANIFTSKITHHTFINTKEICAYTGYGSGQKLKHNLSTVS
jgi:hypothetical protein